MDVIWNTIANSAVSAAPEIDREHVLQQAYKVLPNFLSFFVLMENHVKPMLARFDDISDKELADTFHKITKVRVEGHKDLREAGRHLMSELVCIYEILNPPK